MVKNTQIKDLKEGQILSGIYLSKMHTTAMTKNGKTYLSLVLKDRSGEISAKVWDIPSNFDPVTIQDGWYLCIHGKVETYNGNLQLVIDALKLPTKEDLEKVDIKDIVPCSPYEQEEVLEFIYNTLEEFSDKEISKFVGNIILENEQMLCVAPAAKAIHHAVVGGLLWHMKGMLDIGKAIAGFYPINSDILFAGIILHDIAKLQEFTLSPIGLVSEYSVRGCLLGHISMGMAYLEKMSLKYPISEEKLLLLQHMILSHHGEPEKGSPVRPAFLEAFLLNMIDGMDAHARVYMDTEENLEEGQLSSPVFGLNNVRVYKPLH